MCNAQVERLHRFELSLMPVLLLILNTVKTHEPVTFRTLVCLGNGSEEDVFYRVCEVPVLYEERKDFNIGADFWLDWAIVKIPDLLGFDKNDERVTFVCNEIAHTFQRQVSRFFIKPPRIIDGGIWHDGSKYPGNCLEIVGVPGVGKSLATFVTVLHSAKLAKRNFVWVNLPTGKANSRSDMKVFIRCYGTEFVEEGHSLAFTVPYCVDFFLCLPPETFLVLDGLKCTTFLDAEIELGRFKHIERIAFVHSGPAKSRKKGHGQYWGAPVVRMFSWNLIDYEDAYVRAKDYNIQEFMVSDLAATSRPWAKGILKREILHSGVANRETFTKYLATLCAKPGPLAALMSDFDDFFRWVLVAKLYHAGGCPRYMFKRDFGAMLNLRTEFNFQTASDDEVVNLGGSIHVKHSYCGQYSEDGGYTAVSEFFVDYFNVKGKDENPYDMLSVFKASYNHGIKLNQRGYAGNAYELTVLYYLKSEYAKEKSDRVAIMTPNFEDMAKRLQMQRTANVNFAIHSIHPYSEVGKIHVESVKSLVAVGKGVLLVPMQTNNPGFDLIHITNDTQLSVAEIDKALLNVPDYIPLRVTFLQLTVAQKQHSANFSSAHDVLVRFNVKNVKTVEWMFVFDEDKPDFKSGPCSYALLDAETVKDEDCPKSKIRGVAWKTGNLSANVQLVKSLYSWCTYSCEFM